MTPLMVYNPHILNQLFWRWLQISYHTHFHIYNILRTNISNEISVSKCKSCTTTYNFFLTKNFLYGNSIVLKCIFFTLKKITECILLEMNGNNNLHRYLNWHLSKPTISLPCTATSLNEREIGSYNKS